jgi:hypothetical protein
MSPPIYTPDGQEVTEIVLPDGSTASEVVAPDGSVVFDSGPDIPDSGLLHNYDWSAPSTTAGGVTDQQGSADLSGSFTNFDAINGRQAGYFNGVSDSMQVDWTNIPEPYHIYAVSRFVSVGEDEFILDSFDTGRHAIFSNVDTDFSIFQGLSASITTAADTSDHLFVGEFDTTDVLRIDQTDIFSGDAGSLDSGGLRVGDSAAGGNNGEIVVGEIAVYDPSTSGYSQADVETYFIDKWGPF